MTVADARRYLVAEAGHVFRVELTSKARQWDRVNYVEALDEADARQIFSADSRAERTGRDRRGQRRARPAGAPLGGGVMTTHELARVLLAAPDAPARALAEDGWLDLSALVVEAEDIEYMQLRSEGVAPGAALITVDA